MEKYLLISGATGDIGKSIIKNFLDQGYTVHMVARNQDKLEKTLSYFTETCAEANIFYTVCDVSDYTQVESLYDKIRGSDDKVSVLVNCAGISGGGITEKIKYEDWVNVINNNLNSVFFMCKALLEKKVICEGGRIINIASTGGKQGVIYGAPYCASKHGVVGFSKALGLELARNGSGITVNAVCPGFVESEMAARVREHYSKIWGVDLEATKKRIEDRVPIGRYVEPDEVAAMVSYVASPHASSVTAQALNVCGGLGNY